MTNGQGDTFRREQTFPSEPKQQLGSRRCFFLATLGFGLALSMAGCGSGTTSNNMEEANVFHHDFRGKALPPEFKLYQISDEKILQVEPDGLHIKCEATPSWGTGIKTAFGVKGDFEVTITFELLQTDLAPKSSEVGLTLCLHPAVGDKNTTTTAMDRFFRTNENQGVRWFSRVSSQRVEKPCSDKLCRMRMHRSGTTLHYLWAPGTQGAAFQEIGQSEWPNEIEHVRMAVFGLFQKGGGLDVRLLDFQIRGNLTNTGIFAAPRGALSRALLIGMVITLVLVLGAWFIFRRQRRMKDPSVIV